MSQELAHICAGLVIHSTRDSLTPLARMFALCNHFSKWPCCSGIQYGCHERPVYPICPMPHSGPQSGFSIRISHLNDADVVTGSILIECEDSDTRLYSPDCWSGSEGDVLDDVERHLHRSATLFPTNAYEPHGFHHDGLPVIRDMATSNLPHEGGHARDFPAKSSHFRSSPGWTWLDLAGLASPARLGQVQCLLPKSSAFGPSPAPLGQVQSFQLKSRTFGPSPGVWGQVQPLWAKSRCFGPSPGIPAQVRSISRSCPKSEPRCHSTGVP